MVRFVSFRFFFQTTQIYVQYERRVSSEPLRRIREDGVHVYELIEKET